MRFGACHGHPVSQVRVCYWRSSSYILIVVALQNDVVGQSPCNRLIHMEKISLPIQTLFADLEQRASDAEFLTFFEKTGSFKRRKRKNRYYWYFQNRVGDEVQELYVGPVTDNNVTDKVERFNEIKADFVERREIVKALLSAGLPQTDIVAGRVIEALAEGGFFRMRGVLIGTTAYQCYAGILGVKLGLTTVRTQDADFAQYLSIAWEIDDSTPPILELLKKVDGSFSPVSALDARHCIAFVNRQKYRVEFLTPNRGSDDYEGVPVRLPALAGVSAIPLRFLDFLIRNPIRSVLLYEGGILVTIPHPARYAVHKLIISDRRSIESSKVDKDIGQATELINALSDSRALDLTEAWIEAWERGPSWRQALTSGLMNISQEASKLLYKSIEKNARRLRKDMVQIWPADFPHSGQGEV